MVGVLEMDLGDQLVESWSEVKHWTEGKIMNKRLAVLQRSDRKEFQIAIRLPAEQLYLKIAKVSIECLSDEERSILIDLAEGKYDE